MYVFLVHNANRSFVDTSTRHSVRLYAVSATQITVLSSPVVTCGF